MSTEKKIFVKIKADIAGFYRQSMMNEGLDPKNPYEVEEPAIPEHAKTHWIIKNTHFYLAKDDCEIVPTPVFSEKESEKIKNTVTNKEFVNGGPVPFNLDSIALSDLLYVGKVTEESKSLKRFIHSGPIAPLNVISGKIYVQEKDRPEYYSFDNGSLVGSIHESLIIKNKDSFRRVLCANDNSIHFHKTHHPDTLVGVKEQEEKKGTLSIGITLMPVYMDPEEQKRNNVYVDNQGTAYEKINNDFIAVRTLESELGEKVKVEKIKDHILQESEKQSESQKVKNVLLGIKYQLEDLMIKLPESNGKVFEYKEFDADEHRTKEAYNCHYTWNHKFGDKSMLPYEEAKAKLENERDLRIIEEWKNSPPPIIFNPRISFPSDSEVRDWIKENEELFGFDHNTKLAILAFFGWVKSR